jgi:hypothetical protein
MSVVCSKHERLHGDRTGQSCTMCADPVYPPFIYWRADEQEILICGKCCSRIKPGLIADLIQVCAIRDIQTLAPAYQQTLVRMSEREIIAKEEQEYGPRVIRMKP